MSLHDMKYNEVRIRQGSEFQQIPNFVMAGEALADGMFVTYDGEYYKANSSTRATHFVKRSGEKRNSIEEISTLIGTVQQGEPVMAFTGSGTSTIPFASDVTAGQELTVSDNGYAIALDSLEPYGGVDAYVIGRAVEDVTISEGETLAWGDAWINLPAQFAASVTA